MEGRVLEIGVLQVRPEEHDRFRVAMAESMGLIRAADGCREASIHRSIEARDIYRLIVRWRSLDDHVAVFQTSEAFARLRSLIGGLLVGPPSVDHHHDTGP